MNNIKSELLRHLEKNDLLRAMLVLGKIRDPLLDVDKYTERILNIAAQIWHSSAHARYNPVVVVQEISQVLFSDFGLEAKTARFKHVIDDPDRFYLDLAIEKRIASPLVVTILFEILCGQVGVECECIALPSSYILRLKTPRGEFYVDAFDRGRVISSQEFYAKMKTAIYRASSSAIASTVQTSLFEKLTPAQLVSRCIQQLKHIYILKGAAIEALRCVELQTALHPQSPELARDRGILYCEMEYFSRAIEDLKIYLKHRPRADDVGEIKKLTSMLRGYREIIN